MIDAIRFMKEFVVSYFNQGYLNIQCDKCQKVLKVREGIPTRCPNCGKEFTVIIPRETESQKEIKNIISISEVEGKTVAEVQEFILNPAISDAATMLKITNYITKLRYTIGTEKESK